MKKLFFIASLAIAAIATVFVSCDKNDDDKTTETPEYAEVKLNYQVSKDLLAFADVTFTIQDFNGKTEAIKVSSAEAAEKIITTTSKNAQSKVALDVKPKADFKAEAGREYDLKISCSLEMGKTSDGEYYSQKNINTDLLGGLYIESVYELSEEKQFTQANKRFTISNEVVCVVKDGRFN